MVVNIVPFVHGHGLSVVLTTHLQNELKKRKNEMNTHEHPIFFKFLVNIVSVARCREEKVGKDHGWSCKVQDSQEFKQKVFGSHDLKA